MASWTILPYEIRLPIITHFIEDVISDAAQPQEYMADEIPRLLVEMRAAATVRLLLVLAPELQGTVHSKLQRRLWQLEDAQSKHCNKSWRPAKNDIARAYSRHMQIVGFLVTELSEQPRERTLEESAPMSKYEESSLNWRIEQWLRDIEECAKYNARQASKRIVYVDLVYPRHSSQGQTAHPPHTLRRRPGLPDLRYTARKCERP